MTLKLEEINAFVKGQLNVILVIDQLNALEKEDDDDEPVTNRKAELREWLQILVAGLKSVLLSSSANNHSILNGPLGNRAVKQCTSLEVWLDGRMLVGTPTGDRVGQLHKVPS